MPQKNMSEISEGDWVSYYLSDLQRKSIYGSTDPHIPLNGIVLEVRKTNAPLECFQFRTRDGWSRLFLGDIPFAVVV